MSITNGKPKLSDAVLRLGLEGLQRNVATLLAQLDGRGDRMLTADEIAARMGVTRGYVYHRAKTWEFTRKLSGRALRFSEIGFEQWLKDKGQNGKGASA